MRRLDRVSAQTAVVVLLAAAMPGGTVAAATEPTPAAKREINITTDSAPGWVPSAEQDAQVRKTLMDFLAALDAGRATDAYAYLAPGEKAVEPFAGFSTSLSDFNRVAGAVQERLILKITWTKDPANAPAPGVYAAIDIASHFASIDRHCGYVVLYQSPAGGDFHVMRQEQNYIDNATAAQIEREHSRAELDETWTKLATNCPNYPLPETSSSDIGYPTVAAALTDLRTHKGVTFSTKGGWTVVDDPATHTFWSFPPQGHPAYPSAVRRQFVEENGGTDLQMQVLCESSKSACDDLVRTFERLNAQMAAYARRGGR
jgi:hypothetical protein